MKTIVFKNGNKMKVSQEVVNILVEKMQNNKVNAINNFEFFSDQNRNIIHLINFSEITCIQ